MVLITDFEKQAAFDRVLNVRLIDRPAGGGP